MRRKQLGTVRAWVLATIVTLMLILGIAEIGLRWLVGLGDPPLATRDPSTEYSLRPSARYHRFGNRIAVNRYGMRAPEHAPRKVPGERRVILIGDSVVYGGHELDQAETIAVRLTEHLRRKPELARCGLLVMPAAVSSWGPVNQAAFLARTGLLDADAGVLVVSPHDLEDVPVPGGTVPYRLRPSWSALDDAWQIARERVAPAGQLPPAQPAAERRAATVQALDRLATRFARADRPLVLAFHAGLAPAQEYHAQQQAFGEWARSRGVGWLDLSRSRPDASDYLDALHPAPSGADKLSRLIAEGVAPLLAPCPSKRLSGLGPADEGSDA